MKIELSCRWIARFLRRNSNADISDQRQAINPAEGGAEADAPASEEYPSADVAFEFVIPSYQWALERFERNDNRLQQVVNITATVTAGSPFIAQRVHGENLAEVNIATPLFISATALGVAIILVGLFAKYRGSLKLPGLRQLHSRHLHLDRSEFRLKYISWAGDDQDDNLKTIERKAKMAVFLTVALMVEVGLQAAWIIASAQSLSPDVSLSPGPM